MRLNIKKLTFNLPDNPFGDSSGTMSRLTNDLTDLAKGAGQNSGKYQATYRQVENAVKRGGDITQVMDTPVHVRAMASLLQSEHRDKISLTKRFFNKINEILKRPSSLLIETIFQYYLVKFDDLSDSDATIDWLISAKSSRGKLTKAEDKLLSLSGPKWLANQAIKNDLEFDQVVSEYGLDEYESGRFITTAQGIYYINQLKNIPLNEAHPLLHEVQRQSIYESRYDEDSLLGHKVLRILISRAKGSNIGEDWLNTILAIAGDPRVPSNNPKFIKWWRHIDEALVQSVRGWLSKLDLKLFLEALADFSNTSSNSDLKRMYPARKQFLEGMFDAGVITHTRLYLSWSAAQYLRRHYDEKHLPNFNLVKSGDRSIIYVQMDNAHMIEGSHSCYLWIYRHLDPSACVFNYSISQPTYSMLTSDLNSQMQSYGQGAIAKITHNPANYSWQRKALTSLRELGVKVTPKDVLPPEDYNKFKQRFGVREWS